MPNTETPFSGTAKAVFANTGQIAKLASYKEGKLMVPQLIGKTYGIDFLRSSEVNYKEGILMQSFLTNGMVGIVNANVRLRLSKGITRMARRMVLGFGGLGTDRSGLKEISRIVRRMVLGLGGSRMDRRIARLITLKVIEMGV